MPPSYAAFLDSRGIAKAGGRAVPRWGLDEALSLMDLVGIRAAMLSVFPH